MIIVNAAVWVAIHLSISFIVFLCPESFVLKFSRIYKINKWEKNGSIYENIKIRKWKHRLPEARKWFNKGSGKTAKDLRERGSLWKFELQTYRSELSHWMQMLPAPLFFFFNSPLAGWINMIYAILFNLPFIIIQRYNRSRLAKLKVLLLHRK